MNLAEIKAAAEAESPFAFNAGQVVELRNHRDWLVGRVEELAEALREAVEWARRPSPIPMEPFNEFLRRADKLIGGCICPSHASNRGECPVHDEKGRARA